MLSGEYVYITTVLRDNTIIMIPRITANTFHDMRGDYKGIRRDPWPLARTPPTSNAQTLNPKPVHERAALEELYGRPEGWAVEAKSSRPKYGPPTPLTPPHPTPPPFGALLSFCPLLGNWWGWAVDLGLTCFSPALALILRGILIRDYTKIVYASCRLNEMSVIHFRGFLKQCRSWFARTQGAYFRGSAIGAISLQATCGLHKTCCCTTLGVPRIRIMVPIWETTVFIQGLGILSDHPPRRLSAARRR